MGQYRRKTQNLAIRNGLGGNVDTITQMTSLARARSAVPAVREFALSIIRAAGVGSHNYLAEARAIGEFVQRNVTYVRDPEGIEYLQDPLLLIQDIGQSRAAGDCDDMSLLIATLLLSIGCQPFFRTVRYQNINGPYNHIYVVVYDKNHNGPSQRLVLDAIVKDQPIGYEVPQQSGDEWRV